MVPNIQHIGQSVNSIENILEFVPICVVVVVLWLLSLEWHNSNRMEDVTEFVKLYHPKAFLAATGVPYQIFVKVYKKYCGLCTPISKPIHLYELYCFLKMYPIEATTHIVYQNKRYYEAQHHRLVKARILWLASQMDEIREVWNNRTDPKNRLPHVFPSNVTGCLDSFPIRVSRPKDSSWQSAVYQGKYNLKAHVLKIQAICDHSGSIMWYSGPHIGTTHDLKLWRQHNPRAYMFQNERFLADKAYCSRSHPELLVPWKQHVMVDQPCRWITNKKLIIVFTGGTVQPLSMHLVTWRDSLLLAPDTEENSQGALGISEL